MVKNNSITFWRLIFTLLVASFHFLRLYGINTGWYISVEFFFVVSGFLLIYSCDKKRQNGTAVSPWQYTKHRLGKLYPHYLFTFLLSFGMYSILLFPTFRGKLQALFEASFEMVGIQMIGLNLEIYYNIVAWYVSALLIVGYFIYYLLTNHRKMYVQFIVPLSVILIYSYYYRIYTGMEMWGDSIGFFQHDALLRAIAGMNMGILSYILCNKIQSINWKKWMRYVLDAAEIVGFLFVIVYVFFIHNTDNDYIIAVLMAVCIALAFGHRECNGIFHNKVVNYLSGLSYAMYLNHAIFLSFYKKLAWELNLFTMISFFVLLFITSVITQFIVDKCVLLWNKRIVPLMITQK